MHLKTLSLRGFKSFASVTVLDFEPGITCVVGPNGSGKSNVVDALAWVMGEQGAKSLRGAAMSDVIFAGTSKRSPLGRAEVELTIDNSDGVLPIDYAEVTISRTLFRGGGSEYSINGTACRLLDIQELLSDTGMGREMHVIVGQGQLDSVLSATPEDRRAFIEEAAGILKHQRRKERALRRLESMAANLARLQDLTAELRRQLGPLARQADAARRSAQVQARVRDYQGRILADDLTMLQDTLDNQAQDYAMRGAQLAAVSQSVAEVQAQLSEAAVLQEEQGPALRAATNLAEELTAVSARLKSTQLLADERCRHLAMTSEPAEQVDVSGLQARIHKVAEELQTSTQDITKAQADLAAVVDARKAAEAVAELAEQDLTKLRKTQAEKRENLAKLQGKVAAANSSLEAVSAECERLLGAVGQAEARWEQAKALKSDLPQVSSDIEAVSDLAQDHVVAQEHELSCRQQLDHLLGELSSTKAQAASWEARAKALSLSLKQSTVLDDLRSGHLPGLLGEAVEIFTTKPGWEKALSVALGTLADAVLVDGVDNAVRVLEFALDDEATGITVLIAGGPGIDAGVQAQGEAKAHNMADGDQVGGAEVALTSSSLPIQLPDGAVWARELIVSALPEFAGALDDLLTNTVAVADLAAAQAVIGLYPQLTALTRQGQLLGSRRAQGASGSSLLELRAAWQEANEEALAALQIAEKLEEQIQTARVSLAEAGEQVAAALAQLRAADAQQAQVAAEQAKAGETIRLASEELTRAGQAHANSVASQLLRQEELLRAQAALADAQAQAQSEDGPNEELLVDVSVKAGEQSSQLRAQELEARLRLRTLEEQEKSLINLHQSLQSNLARQQRLGQEAKAAKERRLKSLGIAKQISLQAGLAAQLAEVARAQAVAKRADYEQAGLSLNQVTVSLRQRLEELRGQEGALREARHHEEVANAELNTRLAQLQERAQTEFGLDTQTLCEEFGPHLLVPVFDQNGEVNEQVPYVRSQVAKGLAQAQKDLERIGKVNPLALEEHAALQERHQFLADQLVDLQKSRQDLLTIVSDVDQAVETVFAQAFQDTANAFSAVFTQLFPGGEGKLVLTDPGNMLTTGIEIEARPAGKKVKRLSLLSGGERSLAALAFLVSIFKARPSPFYVLDEVEAALDDTNLSRLIRVFAELEADSQLIIITHQKRTMEIAGALYGVTMRDGVSTVISQRLAS